MSARARIGILIDKKRVKYINNIIDSEPEHLGKDLKEKFRAPEEVESLIENGDCVYPGSPKIYRRDEIWRNVKPKVKDLSSFEKSGGEDYRYIYNPVTKKWKCKHLNDPWFRKI